MMCIKWSRQSTVDSYLPLQCCIQEWVCIQWHSQVGRRLATIHISCILLLRCIFKPHWKLCSPKCILWIQLIPLIYPTHLSHTTTPSKHHSYLSPPPKNQQKQVTKKHFKGWNPQKATKQGRNDTTIPLRIVIPISFTISPASYTHTHTHTKPLVCHTSHIHSQ